VLVNVTRACFQRYPAALITAPIFRCVARLPCVRSACPRSDSFQVVRLNPWSAGGVCRSAKTASCSSSPGRR